MFVQLPGETRFWHALQNAGHGLAFALLTATLLHAIGRRASPSRHALALAATFSLGVVVEIAQHLTGRGFGPADLVMNLAGIVAGTALVGAIRLRRQSLRRGDRSSIRAAPVALLGLAALLWCLRWPIFLATVDALAPTLPLIAHFEQPLALAKLADGSTPARLTLVASDPRWPANGTTSLAADFPPGRWPGFRLVEPPPDWRGYRTLAFRVSNPGARVVHLHVRVDQRADDEDVRRYASVPLEPGAQRIEIALDSMRRPGDRPAERSDPVPLSAVSQILFFLSRSREAATLLFDDVELHR